MPKIFLTHTPAARAQYYGERALAGLRKLGDVRLHESERTLTTPELIAAAKGCDIIVSYRQNAGDGEIFDASPDLVAFLRCAVDIRNIDVAAASRNGVLVTQASPGFVAAVAEMVFGFMIDLARGITEAVHVYRTGAVPEARMGMQLAGATLGVIGYGMIGRRVADLGAAFGMRVLVDDPYAKIDKPGLTKADMPTLLAESDFVVCLAVANAETENLIGAPQFAQMKKSAYFINVSRGNLVDEAALAKALDEKRIAGAAMDVGRAPDQMPSLVLARRPDVIATPHAGGLTPAAIEHQALETVTQAAEIVKGRAPKGAVNADKATRLKRLA